MRIENRELYVTFWSSRKRKGVVGLIIGWTGDDPSELRPVVAYDFGIHELDIPFETWVNPNDAKIEAHWMRGPREKETDR